MDYAFYCNSAIKTKAPELRDELEYKSKWQEGPYDLVAFNPVIHYTDEEGLRNYINIAAKSGAKHVVFSDLLPNKDEDGASHWKIQPYSGGIIPIRMLGEGELVTQMKKAGYRLVTENEGSISYAVDEKSGIPKQYPSVPNYTFVRT